MQHSYRQYSETSMTINPLLSSLGAYLFQAHLSGVRVIQIGELI